jgi:hypothetical protein
MNYRFVAYLKGKILLSPSQIFRAFLRSHYGQPVVVFLRLEKSIYPASTRSDFAFELNKTLCILQHSSLLNTGYKVEV